jgi:hypothetical protein
VENTDPGIVYTDGWRSTSSAGDHGGSVGYNAATGAAYRHTFTGTRITVYSRLTSSSGIAEVRIDGVLIARYNGYSATAVAQQSVFDSGPLAPALHTITVTRAATSTGRNVVLDALRIEHLAP